MFLEFFVFLLEDRIASYGFTPSRVNLIAEEIVDFFTEDLHAQLNFQTAQLVVLIVSISLLLFFDFDELLLKFAS